jgi:hypothetical protein
MTTSLLITHTITGPLDEWIETFTSFDEVRTKAGVTAVQVRHSVEDPSYLAIDLEFGSTAEARAFREFLETTVWPNSPHLGGGTPESRILEPLAVSA